MNIQYYATSEAFVQFDVKMIFLNSQVNIIHFHKKCFALDLILKVSFWISIIAYPILSP